MGSTIRAVRGYMLRHAGQLLAGVVLIIVANVFALVPPLILQRAVDSLSQPNATQALFRYAALIVGVALAAGVFQFFSRFTINSISRYVEYEMRNEVFQHFQRLDLEYFQQRKLGDLVARATNDLSQVRQMLGPGVSNLCNAMVAFVLTGIAMLSVDVRLTLYSLTVMPAITVFFVLISGTIRRHFRAVQDQFGEVSARAQENFSGIRVVKAYAQEAAELEAFNQVNLEYVTRSITYARLNSLLYPSMYFISGLAVAIMLWRGGLDVVSGRITVGHLVQFTAYLAALTWPMISLGWTVNLFQQGSASLSRIQEVRTTLPAVADRHAALGTFAPHAGKIEFRNVSFSYGEREVLHNINLLVPAGTSLGIVGPTGSGKSSLVNLIARIYDATSGSVLIDDHDVLDIPLADLRQAVGYVPQESFLFSLSLRENVGFGVDTLTNEQLEHALEVAQLGKDVIDFPQGVETMVGERGVTLSGGQKQRASIARAIARNPLILMLDEAFSNVDTNTEAAIMTQLSHVMRDRTSIIVAHRISTVQHLDRIIVLRDGCIVEEGTHTELLALDGTYTALYRRQLLGEELEESDLAGSSEAAD